MAKSTNASSIARDLAFGFIAGALAVAIFHQIMLLILAKAGMISGTPYSLRPIPPYNVPAVINTMFWGGIWGVVYAALVDRLAANWPFWLGGLVFGAIVPVLVGWFVVAPIKGLPLAAGFVPPDMLASVLINAFWGLGTAIIYAGLRIWALGSSRPTAV
jgi:hypothetical protein